MDRILAIARLRFKLQHRRMRGAGGTLNLIGVAVLGVLVGVFALAVAAGFGLLLHVFASGDDVGSVRIGFLIVFYVALVFGVVVPLFRGTLEQGFDASPFLLFPIGRFRLYLTTLGASALAPDHLFYYPSLLAVALTGVWLAGVDRAAGLALILLLAASFVIWGHLLALLLTSVMRARRVREFAAIAALLLLIAGSFLPMLLDSREDGSKGEAPRIRVKLESAGRMTAVLPPTLAADGLSALHRNAPAEGWLDVLWLSLWCAAGVGLGYRVFDRLHLGERGGDSSAGSAAASRRLEGLLTFDGRLFARFPPAARAVAAKDLRYLLRSVVGRFVLLVTPLFVLLMVFVLGRHLTEPVFGILPDRLLFFGLILYTVLFSNNFINNAFAWENDGIKFYFMSPVALKHVLLGKNLAVWVYNALLFGLFIVSWSLGMGPPDPLTLLSGLFLFSAASLAWTAFGNILSIRFPVPRDMSTARNQPAQVSILLSLVLLVLTAAALGPFISLPLLLGLAWLQPLLLGGVALGMYGVYAVALSYAARLFEQRREPLIEALKSAS